MKSYLPWIFRLTASIILFQTLFFKFSAAPESVYIFNTLGLGAIGRIGSGVAELIAGVLLLTPHFTKIGSVLTINIMAGAILSHITVLGIEVQGDGGTLFTLALATLFCAIINLFLSPQKLRVLNFEI